MKIRYDRESGLFCEPDGVVTDSRRIEQLTAERDALLGACKSIAAGPIGEPQIDLTGEYMTGLHCGLEDHNIQDHYDACNYGFESGVERGLEWAQGIVADAIAKAEPKT